MINPQKGIDLMNNTSIINRILFAVTIFQQNLAKERKKDLIKKVNDKANTQYTEILP
jgi:hypothetical protein